MYISIAAHNNCEQVLGTFEKKKRKQSDVANYSALWMLLLYGAYIILLIIRKHSFTLLSPSRIYPQLIQWHHHHILLSHGVYAVSTTRQ